MQSKLERRGNLEAFRYGIFALKDKIGHNLCDFWGHSETNFKASIRYVVLGPVWIRAEHWRSGSCAGAKAGPTLYNGRMLKLRHHAARACEQRVQLGIGRGWILECAFGRGADSERAVGMRDEM